MISVISPRSVILPYKIEKSFKIKNKFPIIPQDSSVQPRVMNFRHFNCLNFSGEADCLTLVDPKNPELGKVPMKIEKDLLKENVFIGQIENKFLVSVAQGILLLWDQHALHERIRLEHLQAKFIFSSGETCSVLSYLTSEKIKLNLTKIQLKILKGPEHKFKRFGLGLSGIHMVQM